MEASTRQRLRKILDAAGSPEALLSILERFYDRMARDAMLEHFFAGKDTREIARKQRDFLLKAMGASEKYDGKTPGKAHGAIPPIFQGHFHRRLKILTEVLRESSLPEAEIEAWLDFERAFFDEIVKK